MTDRRLVEACTDAQDCLTRAAALYRQFWDDAAFPMQSTQAVKAPGKPESRAPSSGDTAARRMLAATVRHVGKGAAILAGINGERQPRFPLTGGSSHPDVVEAHVAFACRQLDVAVATVDALEVDVRRRVHHAAAAARSALKVWDTPPPTDAMQGLEPGTIAYARAAKVARDEHGTAVVPPSHYPAGERCWRCRFRVPSAGRKDCETCRKRIQRERDDQVRKARREHRAAMWADGVQAPHTAADFELCACDPRRQRRRERRRTG